VLTHPILLITWVAHQVENGDLNQRAPVWANDEIGTLGQAFNSMIDGLARSQEELKRRDIIRTRLLAKSVTAQEQERERISRELHDETGQALTALLVQLKVLEHLPDMAAVGNHARELREIVAQLLEEVRRLARDLRPSTLDNLGLAPTLAWYIQSYKDKTNIDIYYRSRLPDNYRLPSHTELALYRVVQEALTNVARHADATRASVWLELDDDIVRLGIEDNGCGFDLESTLNSQDRSLGLLGIQERVEIIGGTVHLSSTTGTGTCLQVEVAVLPQ
jgi:signal transduction histidine kinase